MRFPIEGARSLICPPIESMIFYLSALPNISWLPPCRQTTNFSSLSNQSYLDENVVSVDESSAISYGSNIPPKVLYRAKPYILSSRHFILIFVPFLLCSSGFSHQLLSDILSSIFQVFNVAKVVKGHLDSTLALLSSLLRRLFLFRNG